MVGNQRRAGPFLDVPVFLNLSLLGRLFQPFSLIFFGSCACSESSFDEIHRHMNDCRLKCMAFFLYLCSDVLFIDLLEIQIFPYIFIKYNFFSFLFL